MNVLSRDSLWQKAKLYARRAIAAAPGDPTFGLWATLALEFLARSSIASVHPVLVAEPGEPQYLLYAFGYRTDRAPRSIPAKAVFARCEAMIPAFTDAERRFSMGLVERRNAELHSGEPAFHDHPSSDWLAEYYRVCEILLGFQGRGLGHLMGADAARTARRLIKATESDVKETVLGEISRRRAAFEDLDPSAQAQLRSDAALKARANVLGNVLGRGLAQRIRCPACASFAVSWGQRVRSGEPIAEEDTVVIRTVVLPTRFACYACELRLSSHPQLHFAGIGDQFTVNEYTEPSDCYGLYQPEPEDYDEYMNE
jgi:hypothetical protein